MAEIKSYTDLRQSEKLEGILPIKSADMHSEAIEIDGDMVFVVVCGLGDKNKSNYGSPIWSLGALLDLLPPSIQTGEGMRNQYEIKIRKYWGNEENLYQIAYGNNRGLSEEWHDMINTGEKENLIDAAFEMVCWLLKNNYIEKGE